MKVRWRRLTSPAGIVRAYRSVIARANRVKTQDLMLDPRMIDAIQRMGMWAFVDTKTRIVRYWHDGKRSQSELAFMLGHELGHATGKPLRGHVAEERRADEYGAVAAAVLEHLERVS